MLPLCIQSGSALRLGAGQSLSTSSKSSSKPKLLTKEQIIRSARLFFYKKGVFPSCKYGKTVSVPGMHIDETWSALNQALKNESRGLVGSTTLSTLLMPLRQELVALGHLKANAATKGELTTSQIIKSAQQFFDTTGELPSHHDGVGVLVPGMHRDETWSAVDSALRNGSRGLEGGTNLYNLLTPLRESLVSSGQLKADSRQKGDLNLSSIINSAELFFNKFGGLPNQLHGSETPVPGMHKDETWKAIDQALIKGLRGLVGGSNLKKLLSPLKKKLIAQKKLKADAEEKGDLSKEKILASARAFFDEYGTLPIATDGIETPVPGLHIDETWNAINQSLVNGYRGLTAGSSLSLVLEPLKQELVSKGLLRADQKEKGDLTIEAIVQSARLFFQETGNLPTNMDGKGIVVPGMHCDETWMAIDGALIKGSRGLEGQTSLSIILQDLRNELISSGDLRARAKEKGDLTNDQIMTSAVLFFEGNGRFPNHHDGKGVPAPGLHRDETWNAINQALIKGNRGLTGGTTLSQLLKPLQDKFALHLTGLKRPRAFQDKRSPSPKLRTKTSTLTTCFEKKTKPVTNFIKGDAFEQVVGLLLASLNPDELIVPQYCLRVEPENKYFGMRVDYKVGTDVYEIKWGKASGNIVDTYHKHMQYLPDGMNYHLLMLEANGDIGLPYDHFSFEVLKSPLRQVLTETVNYLKDLVKQDDGIELENLRNYLYGLLMKSNQLQNDDRMDFIASELSQLYLNKPEDRRDFMRSHTYALYSPLEAYCEHNGHLWRDLITVKGLDSERPGQYQLSYYLNNLRFPNQIDRDIAVVLEMTEDGFRTEDLLEESESGKYDEALFRLPNGETLASRASALTADHIIDSIDDLKILFDFAAGDFEFAKEFIRSYS